MGREYTQQISTFTWAISRTESDTEKAFKSKIIKRCTKECLRKEKRKGLAFITIKKQRHMRVISKVEPNTDTENGTISELISSIKDFLYREKDKD